MMNNSLNFYQERNDYLPLAKHGSKLYFVISDLSKVNNMYQFSLAAFLRLFQRNIERTDVSEFKCKISK